jgi:hypothetical protein
LDRHNSNGDSGTMIQAFAERREPGLAKLRCANIQWKDPARRGVFVELVRQRIVSK